MSHLIDVKKLLLDVGITPGHKLGNFGIGHSAHVALTAAKIVGHEGKVFAVDILPPLLAMLESHAQANQLHNVQTVHGNYETFCGVPLPPDSLDAVVAMHHLWRVKDLAAMTREALRLLKSEGKFILVDWHAHSIHPVAPPRESRLPLNQVKRQLISAGFHDWQEIPVDIHHWALVLRAP